MKQQLGKKKRRKDRKGEASFAAEALTHDHRATSPTLADKTSEREIRCRTSVLCDWSILCTLFDLIGQKVQPINTFTMNTLSG